MTIQQLLLSLLLCSKIYAVKYKSREGLEEDWKKKNQSLLQNFQN